MPTADPEPTPSETAVPISAPIESENTGLTTGLWIGGAVVAILAAAGAVAMTGVDLEQFYAALVLLGIGWNFGFIGATTLLSTAHAPEERGRIQGINDLVVFGGVTAASFASGGLMNCSGTSVVAGWQAVNLAMIPFLVLAGGSLIWLVLRPKA